MVNPVMPTRRGVLLGAASLAVASAAASPAHAQLLNPLKALRATELSLALRKSQPMPGLSLAVANARGVLWAEAYGTADRELDIEVNPGHRFKLGSVSKVLTSTAAARLVSRGALDLDAPIMTWLPDLPEQHRRTTMTQLLTHRGGIRHYIQRDIDPAAPGGPIDFREYANNQAILDVFIHDPLVAAPGSQVLYSTFGYTLASLVIEQAGGKSFPELIKADIGGAFGMASLDNDAPQDIRPLRAKGYNDSASRAILAGRAPTPGLPAELTNARQTNPAYKWAGGGFIATAADLALFGAGVLPSEDSKITPAERALLFTPLTEATREQPPLGLGWRVDADTKGRQRWHHAGGQEGGRASLAVYPALGLSIAFASNLMTAPGNVLTPSSDLADIFA